MSSAVITPNEATFEVHYGEGEKAPFTKQTGDILLIISAAHADGVTNHEVNDPRLRIH